MDDLISRQAAIDAIHNKMILVGSYLTDSSVGFEFAEDEINNLPSADVVPVVRCKECIHNNDCDIQYSAQAGENFFCGFGETEKDVREDVYE